MFLTTFSAIFSDTDIPAPCVHLSPHPDCEQLIDAIFSPSTIAKIINNYTSYSAGPDGVPPYLLKFTSRFSAPLLSSVFAECLRSGSIPSTWRHAIVTPIFKGKGPPNDAKGYRPISVTSALSRTFERCLLSYLLPILKSCGAIPPDQYGSLPNRSCLSQLITAFHSIALRQDKGEPTDIIYFDFDKAFDRVDRSLLLQRLRATAIHPLVCHLIEVLFSCRTHQVRVGNALSPIASVTSGVVQGTVLGPILFIVFTSSVPSLSWPLKSFSYVDDYKWIAPVSSLTDGFALQSSCDRFHSWCEANHLPLSSGKCRVMHIGHNNPSFTLHLSGSPILDTSVYTDLGVIFRSDLSFSEHCNATVAKAMNIVMMLRRCFSDCDAPTLVYAFQTYVNPILHYCSPVWSPSKVSDIQALERPLRLFTKYLPGMRTYSYQNRLARLGLHSLEWIRLQRDIILCFKIVHGLVYIDPANPIIQLSTNRTRGHPLTIHIPFARMNTLFSSFVCRVSRVWNSLPADIVTAPTLPAFRRRIKSLDISTHLSVFKF